MTKPTTKLQNFVMEFFDAKLGYDLFLTLHRRYAIKSLPMEETVTVSLRVGNTVIVRGTASEKTRNEIYKFVDSFKNNPIFRKTAIDKSNGFA